MSTEESPFDLREQEEAQRRNEEKQRLAKLQEDEDLRWLMGTVRGRRVMWRLLGISGLFRNPFAGVREQTDFNCGMQAIGQTLIAQIHATCPELYHEMVREQQPSDDANAARK